MKKNLKFLFLTVVLCFIAINVQAKEINHFSSKADSEITLEDTYNSSVAVAGDDIELNAIVKGISIIAGNQIELTGETDYGIYAGNTIRLSGTVNNDIIIAGNLITSNNNAHFKRDTIIAGNDIEISGTFDRNISIYSSKVTFKNAVVKGNVKIYSEKVTIEDGTTINGNLSYPEDSIYKASADAKIGKIIKTDAIQTTDDENYFATVSSKIWSFVCMALVFTAMSLFFPNIFNKITEKFEKTEINEIVKVFTEGLVIIILVPVISILLCCTMIGVPLGIILLIMYAVAIYLTTIFTAYLLGYKIWQKIFKKPANLLPIGIIGLFILMILNLIPGVRILVTIITILIGLGLIFECLKQKQS